MSNNILFQKTRDLLRPRLIIIALMLAFAARWLADNLGEFQRRAYLPHMPQGMPLLTDILNEKSEITLALFLWALAGLVFYRALGNKLEEAKAHDKLSYFSNSRRSPRLNANILTMALGIFLPAAIALNILLYHHHHQGTLGWSDIGLWLGAGVLLLVFFFLLDLSANKNFLHLSPLSRTETLWLILLSFFALRLYALDINSWRYSFIGDEYAFYDFIQKLLKLGQIKDLNPFSPAAVYDSHPAMSSYYQALVVRLFGTDNTGWRLSSNLAAAACLIPFYVLLKSLFGRREAIIGTILLFASHYFIAFSHLGYNNNHVIFPLVLGLAACFWGIESGSLFGFALAGTACGWGFYTFYSSRLTIGVILIFFLVMFIDRLRSRHVVYLGILFLTFFLTIAPQLMNSHGNFKINLLKETMFRQELNDLSAKTGQATRVDQASKEVSPEVFLQLKLTTATKKLVVNNIILSLLVPLHYQAKSPFVHGQLLDYLSGAFCLLGLAYSLFWGLRRRDYLALNLSYLICLLAVGALSHHHYPPVTRLFFILPFLLVYATIGIRGALLLLSPLMPTARLGRFLLLAILGLNLWQVYYRSPSKLASTPLALKVKLAKKHPTHRIYTLESRLDMCARHKQIKEIYHLDNFSQTYTLNPQAPGWHDLHFKTPALITLWGHDNQQIMVMAAMLNKALPRGKLRVIYDAIRFRYLYYFSLEDYPAGTNLSLTNDSLYTHRKINIQGIANVKHPPPDTHHKLKSRAVNYFYPAIEQETKAPLPLGLGDNFNPADLADWLQALPGVNKVEITDPPDTVEIMPYELPLLGGFHIELVYE